MFYFMVKIVDGFVTVCTYCHFHLSALWFSWHSPYCMKLLLFVPMASSIWLVLLFTVVYAGFITNGILYCMLLFALLYWLLIWFSWRYCVGCVCYCCFCGFLYFLHTGLLIFALLCGFCNLGLNCVVVLLCLFLHGFFVLCALWWQLLFI
jgi:hypothetical protein